MSLIPADCRKLRRPDGLSQIVETFGDPRPLIGLDGLIAPSWELRNITRVKLLQPLPYMHSHVERIAVHVRIAALVKDIFEELVDEDHWRKIREFGGGYECRATRGGGGLSVHAWGIGIDLRPVPDEHGRHLMPREIVRAFTRRGFIHGGDWCREDHFQFATGYGLEWPELPDVVRQRSAIAV